MAAFRPLMLSRLDVLILYWGPHGHFDGIHCTHKQLKIISRSHPNIYDNFIDVDGPGNPKSFYSFISMFKFGLNSLLARFFSRSG